MEWRLRQLVLKLEFVDSLTLAHPFVKGFEQSLHCLNEEEVRTCASGEVPEVVLRRKKEDIEEKEGSSTIYTTTFYIGLAIEPKQRALFTIVSLKFDSCSLHPKREPPGRKN